MKRTDQWAQVTGCIRYDDVHSLGTGSKYRTLPADDIPTGDVDAIEAWFLRCVNPPSKLIRQACLTILVERRATDTLVRIQDHHGFYTVSRSIVDGG